MLELMDRHVAAHTMSDLAALHVRNGALRDAVTCYERALEALREEGDREGAARTLRRLTETRELAAAQAAPARSNARTAS